MNSRLDAVQRSCRSRPTRAEAGALDSPQSGETLF